jgi:uncharacterized protein with PIN domain
VGKNKHAGNLVEENQNKKPDERNQRERGLIQENGNPPAEPCESLRSRLERAGYGPSMVSLLRRAERFPAAGEPREAAEAPFRRDRPGEGLIESFGVPHTEVDLVLINGESVAFSHSVPDGDRISVYPVFASLDVSFVSQVRLSPLPAPRVVLDVHLGSLAAYLRMAGFDALYRNNASDSDLVAVVERDRRALVTRDLYLLMRSDVDRRYWVRSTNSRQQLMEVVRRFDLLRRMQPFTRCMKCNGVLNAVTRDEVSDRLPARVSDKILLWWAYDTAPSPIPARLVRTSSGCCSYGRGFGWCGIGHQWPGAGSTRWRK